MNPTQLVNREPWTEQAACRGRWELFDFSPTREVAPRKKRQSKRDIYAPAIAICQQCPVFTECDEMARRIEPRGGVWAGAVFNDAGKPWRPVGRPRKADA